MAIVIPVRRWRMPKVNLAESDESHILLFILGNHTLYSKLLAVKKVQQQQQQQQQQ
jgi:hypothetical protein